MILIIVTKSSILGVVAVLDTLLEWKQLWFCTLLWRNDQLRDQFLLMRLEKKLSWPRLSAMLQSNTKSLPVKTYFTLLRKQIWEAKQLSEVHFYGSHMHRNQNTDHAKTLWHFINKSKTRFDYRKSLNKNISLNALIFEWIKICFDWI